MPAPPPQQRRLGWGTRGMDRSFSTPSARLRCTSFRAVMDESSSARRLRKPASTSGLTQTLCSACIRLRSTFVPEIARMRIHDAWAGLSPCSPDSLPILGATSLPDLRAAGHYRDGILLAPITALLMTQLLTGQSTSFDLAPFSPLRFVNSITV